jgi:hypothetical protein
MLLETTVFKKAGYRNFFQTYIICFYPRQTYCADFKVYSFFCRSQKNTGNGVNKPAGGIVTGMT